MVARFSGLLLHLKNRFVEEEGQDLVEYALIVAVLSLAIIAAEENVATSIYGAYQHLTSTFNALVSTS